MAETLEFSSTSTKAKVTVSLNASAPLELKCAVLT